MRYDNDVQLVLDQHAQMNFYSASSLRQQSDGKLVASLRHIILIQSKQVFALSPLYCVLSGEATHIKYIVFCLTRPAFKPTIYHILG